MGQHLAGKRKAVANITSRSNLATSALVIQCQNCPKTFSSLLLPREKALGNITDQLTVHYQERHPEVLKVVAAQLKELTMVAGWYLMTNALFTIPEDQTYIWEQYELHGDRILAILGYEDEEEEEGEDEIGLPDVELVASRTGVSKEDVARVYVALEAIANEEEQPEAGAAELHCSVEEELLEGQTEGVQNSSTHSSTPNEVPEHGEE